MAETITALVASQRLKQLAKRIAGLRRFVCKEIVRDMIRRGVHHIAGGTMDAIGRNRDYARYYGATFRGNVNDDGTLYTTGLPADEETAQILAFKNKGGTIYPKQDRPNPHLRIPLPAALLPSGYERMGLTGVLLRLQPKPWGFPGAKNPFVLIGRKTGNLGLGLPKQKRGRGQRAALIGIERWYDLVRSKTYAAEPWWTNTVADEEANLDALLTSSLAKYQAKLAGEKAATP